MYKEKIDAYIDAKKEEMLADLTALVKIDSQRMDAKEGMPFGEGPAKVLAAAEELMKKCGFLTKNYENYVVTGDLSEEEKGLDILAHLDVVPVTEDWTVTQPFEPKIVDGRIYGRGTADDKGPAIAAMYAMRAIKELGIPLKRNVRLILGSDEECGSSDLDHYYAIEKEAPYTFSPDAEYPVINIEKGRLAPTVTGEFADGLQLPGVVSLKSGDKVNIVPQRATIVLAGLDPETVEKAAQEVSAETGVTFTVSEVSGQDQIKVDVRGKAAHASTPEEGKNALTAALRLVAGLPLAETQGQKALKALDKYFPYEDTCGKALGIYREEEESGEVTMALSVMNYTPEKLTGCFDARLPIGCTEENTRQPIVDALEKYGLTVSDKPMTPPHCVPGDSDFVRTLLASYERYTGIKGKPLAMGGGTYVHSLENGVAFGCMSFDVDNHMHGDDEFMEIDVLIMSAKIFADAILTVCNTLE